jgi:tRNA 2-selenouridine synthase
VLPGGWINYRRWVQVGSTVLPRLVLWRVVSCALGTETARVLDALRAAGQQVLDVDALAGRRRQALGARQEPSPSQAWFESRLLQALRSFDAQAPVWVGDLDGGAGTPDLPEALTRAIEIAPTATLQVDLPERVRCWREDEPLLRGDASRLLDALAALVPAPGPEALARWRAMARAGVSDELLTAVLSDHFDPLHATQLSTRAALRHALPPLTTPSLAMEDLAAAVQTWLPMRRAGLDHEW